MKKTITGLAPYGRKTHTGFTIVELLIVIVVIAILATISVVAYRGIQVRARDTLRADTIAKIKRALELYKADYGRYPNATANPGFEGWEASTDASGSFMEYLKDYGFPNGAPVDPINNASFRIKYYRYPPGAAAWAAGCDVSKGGFYVLTAIFEDRGNKPAGNSITSECTAPPSGWADAGGNGPTYYAFHAFEN